MTTVFKCIKQNAFVFFTLLFVVCFGLSQVTFANNSVIYTDRKCNLGLTYQSDGTPIEGASFQIYHVADVNDDVTFDMKDEFVDSGVELTADNNKEWLEKAATLSSYIALEESKGNEINVVADGVTNKDGEVDFEGLQTGMYLLTGEPTIVDNVKYTAVDTLLMLPAMESDGNIDYNPVVYPKETNMIVTHDNPSDENDEYITLRAQKIWKDTGYENQRPESVTVVLLQDGKEYDRVELSKANNWRCEWTNLYKDSDWKLSEDNVPSNYNVTSVLDGNTFIVTNTRKTSSSGGPGRNPGGTPTTERTTESATETTTERTAWHEQDNSTESTTYPNDNTINNSHNPSDVTDNPEDEDGLDSSDMDRYGISKKPGDRTSDEQPDNPTDSDNPNSSTSAKENLPQTGQLWWPIPVFLICGLTLFMMGVKANEKNNEQK
jgi:hypothetical protein